MRASGPRRQGLLYGFRDKGFAEQSVANFSGAFRGVTGDRRRALRIEIDQIFLDEAPLLRVELRLYSLHGWARPRNAKGPGGFPSSPLIEYGDLIADQSGFVKRKLMRRLSICSAALRPEPPTAGSARRRRGLV